MSIVLAEGGDPRVVAAAERAAAERLCRVSVVGTEEEVELYGRQTTWPGSDQVYLIEKGMKKSVPITCEAGERICWAAWVNGDAGASWGVGPNRDRQCNDCCVICVGKTTATVEIGG